MILFAFSGNNNDKILDKENIDFLESIDWYNKLANKGASTLNPKVLINNDYYYDYYT